MQLRNIALTAAALGLAAAPVAAETYRASAPVTASSELEGQSDLFIILGVAALIGGIIVLVADDDDPVSP
ncbi:hypothetical protein ACXYL9_12035 [Qipengyuania sp. CAU 1752]